MTDHLILLCGHPRAGASLPRLRPMLGDAGAARLQGRLVERTVDTARRWRDEAPDRHIAVACQGAPAGEFRAWLGDDLFYAGDSGGSPGARRAVASVRAFTHGADRVALVGNSCPDLATAQIDRAFFALEQVDCVLGPGHTGRYYLIGLVAPAPYLFAGVPWGTSAVLARTLAVARQHRLRVGVMETLPMVQGPSDLIHAAPLIAEYMEEPAAARVGEDAEETRH